MDPIIKKGDALLREKNLKRANFKCEMCGTDQDRLDNHHLLPKSVYPQHRFRPENTTILCRKKCHYEAEVFPERFLSEAVLIPRLRDRVLWRDEHNKIGMNPVEVDYEGMFEVLNQSEI